MNYAQYDRHRLMPVELQSERLVLRGFQRDDFEDLCRLHADERVVRYLGQGGKPRSREETWRGLTSYVGQWLLLGYGLYAVTARNGKLLGRAGIYHPQHWPCPEIAYAFFPECWGKNLATETVALIRYAIPAGAFARLVSFIHPENNASARVAQKNDAVLSGTHLLDGTEVNVWEYPLTMH